MTPRHSLQDEIKQAKPFSSYEEEAYLNLQRTTDRLLQGVRELLDPHDLSPAQYNVLRILRGAEPDGLPCGGIRERMVTRVPDVTRLLDRLEPRGLITRERRPPDRRVVRARITQAGLTLLAELDAPMRALHREQMGHLGEDALQTLIDLLERVRQPDGA